MTQTIARTCCGLEMRSRWIRVNSFNLVALSFKGTSPKIMISEGWFVSSR